MLERFLAAAATGPDEPRHAVLTDWIGRVVAISAGLLTAIALFEICRRTYRRTLGRKRDLYARLRRLGTNAQISFFSSVLGEPPAMRRHELSTVTIFDESGTASQVPKEWIECVWIDRDFYVHAFADLEETIHAFSVVTRSKRFHPKVPSPWGTWIERGRLMRHLGFPDKWKEARAIKLGKTRFSELERPDKAASWVGMRNVHYFEALWGGNPGLYQWFIYGINDAGYGAFDSGWTEDMHDFTWGFDEDILDPQLALTQAALEADAAPQVEEPQLPDNAIEEIEPDDDDLFEEHEEVPLPAAFDAFRHRAKSTCTPCSDQNYRSTTTPSSRARRITTPPCSDRAVSERARSLHSDSGSAPASGRSTLSAELSLPHRHHGQRGLPCGLGGSRRPGGEPNARALPTIRPFRRS